MWCYGFWVFTLAFILVCLYGCCSGLLASMTYNDVKWATGFCAVAGCWFAFRTWLACWLIHERHQNFIFLGKILARKWAWRTNVEQLEIFNAKPLELSRFNISFFFFFFSQVLLKNCNVSSFWSKLWCLVWLVF